MIKCAKLNKKLMGLALCLLGVVGCETLSGLFNSNPTYSGPKASEPFPARPKNAMSGSQFMKITAYMDSARREQAIWEQLRIGNMPSFLRQGKPIFFNATNGKTTNRLTIWVLPDYLAIGSDLDFVRIPMTPMTAQKIADKFGYVLPTRKMVNEIYRQSQVKIAPKPMPPGQKMVTNEYYKTHNRTIEGQLKGKNRNLVVAGHKKDIVVSNLLNRKPYRVAIYGWHKLNGKAIQPLSTVHGNTYADYSHGVRLVRNMVNLNGKMISIFNVVRSSALAGLISDEGPIANYHLRINADSVSDLRANDVDVFNWQMASGN